MKKEKSKWEIVFDAEKDNLNITIAYLQYKYNLIYYNAKQSCDAIKEHQRINNESID